MKKNKEELLNCTDKITLWNGVSTWVYPQLILCGRRKNDTYVLATIIPKIAPASSIDFDKNPMPTVRIDDIEDIDIHKVFNDLTTGHNTLVREQLGEWDDFLTPDEFIQSIRFNFTDSCIPKLENCIGCKKIWLNFNASQI